MNRIPAVYRKRALVLTALFLGSGLGIQALVPILETAFGGPGRVLINAVVILIFMRIASVWWDQAGESHNTSSIEGNT